MQYLSSLQLPHTDYLLLNEIHLLSAPAVPALAVLVEDADYYDDDEGKDGNADADNQHHVVPGRVALVVNSTSRVTPGTKILSNLQISNESYSLRR
jgi:hypothetical protein